MKCLLPILALFMLFIVACSDRPEGVLSPSKMEDVLYDYHLMQGIIEQLPYEQRTEKAQDYINAVYEKHHITEAQFDSSIVYYNRHTKDLYNIYNNLKNRYTAANEEIQLRNGNNDMMAIFASGGDTTNLWNSQRLLSLHAKAMNNMESYTILADTTFRRHDQFILTFTPVFLKDMKNDDHTSLCVGLSILYTDNKHIGITRTISHDGIQQLNLTAAADKDIQRITGFFYYRGKAHTRNLCLIDDISLVRMHQKESVPIPKKDTLKTDTLSKDTLPRPAERRFTPEERRQQNKSNEHIDILKAPSVRKPNSIGPRRRKMPQQPPHK